MDFKIFKSKVSKLKKIELPGEAAHHKLAPLMRIQELANVDIEKKKPNEAGVLALFYPDESSKTKLVLILRKTYKGVHSNQVGFPGGRVEEEDRDLSETALRETEEEVGVQRTLITVLKKLTKLYIPPSNFWVHPYIGIMDTTPILIAQESEVEDILEVDLDDFLDEKNMVKQVLSTSYAKEIEVPAFSLNGHIVWGATGMMLSEIKEMLVKVL
ncbi:CoA pyrophosphatase [Salegentibacter sp. F188]|uniref:CoA pyrophosphatase n=1 Tax=Autumnicola patrickiae TaxID=3075591 RepID=A0ABU3DZC9_9FLAO|nr:CoA pyrophosphatase [Salegentibacter sp. F188]MDT0689055.1 CoA pyrophosphatase [Salegentibacter sp. F188]